NYHRKEQMKMADTFRIYKGDTKIVEGASPLSITGIEPATEVAAGEYKATRVQNGKESAKVDIPAFTVKTAETFSADVDVKPTSANKVEEIKAWLTANDIDYAGKTTKTDLLALVSKD
ncbi:hypothetical protein, partial [Enterococcus gallinarum]|uniref:hypothetical protein n=1 Tax=Enterococcus TaxID=1350 RepID=UPI003F75A9F2